MPEPPGRARRRPSRGSPSWWIREPLARWLEAEGETSAGLRVLDVGCGVKPYAPFFADAAEYVGVDVVDNPHADLTGPAERLPVEDASFDLVLCIQVLEHVDDPAAAVRELHRVVRPGGLVLASTHGTQVYHPSPADHWRWTQTGLERLFSGAGSWRSATVTPGAGTGATLAMLLGTYVDIVNDKLHGGPVGRLVIRGLNRAGGAIDRRSTRMRETVPGSLTANFHVRAER